jgi:long-chain acyl-CoA synthetase
MPRESLSEYDTLPKLLAFNYKEVPNKLAMRFKDLGIWKTYTWGDCYDTVKAFSLGMASLGLNRGNRVAIIGENQPEWYFGELGIQALGGICVGIFVDAIPSEVKYILQHCDASFVIAHDQEQVDKILQIRGEIPSVKKVIYWDNKGLWFYTDPGLASFDQVKILGREYAGRSPRFFEAEVAEGKGGDCAVISYTSGTTGLPKGAMLAHRTIIGNRVAWLQANPCQEGDDYLSCLSPAWAAEQYLGVAGGLLSRSIVNFPESAETVQGDVREIEPHILFYGSRQWENLKAMIQVKLAGGRRFNKRMYDTFMTLTDKCASQKVEKQEVSYARRIIEWATDIVMLRPLRNKLGLNRIRHAYIGGSGVSPDIIRYFRAIGVNVKQIYGLSETGVNVCHTDEDIDPLTSGPPLPNNEIKISAAGEVLIRTDCMFMGYYKNEDAKTEKVDSDGWFHTGDYGYIDKKGHLVIIDRLSDLKSLKSGYKYSPQFIEIRLRSTPYIKDAVAIGSSANEYVTTIINIDFENVGKWAEINRIPYTTFIDLSQKDEVAELIGKDIGAVNGQLPEESRVKKFVCLHKEFDADEAELTRTRKIRRAFVEERYQNIITGMYGQSMQIPVESEVTYQDGRKSIIKTMVKVRSMA